MASESELRPFQVGLLAMIGSTRKARTRDPLYTGTVLRCPMPNSPFAVCAVVAAASFAPLIAQETKAISRLTTEHYFDLERVSDAQISPDGSRTVYTRQQVNKLEDKWNS
jgi:hypothetical protein